MSAMVMNFVRRLLLLFVTCCDVGFGLWVDCVEFVRLAYCCCADRWAVWYPRLPQVE